MFFVLECCCLCSSIPLNTETFGFGMKEDVASLCWCFLPDFLMCLTQWFKFHKQCIGREWCYDFGSEIWCEKGPRWKNRTVHFLLVTVCHSGFCSSNLLSLRPSLILNLRIYLLLPSTLNVFQISWNTRPFLVALATSFPQKADFKFVFLKSEFSWLRYLLYMLELSCCTRPVISSQN